MLWCVNEDGLRIFTQDKKAGSTHEAPGCDIKNIKHLLIQKHFAHVQKVKAAATI